MPSWLLIAAAVVVVLALGFAREGFRVRGIERWAAEHGFRYATPPTEDERTGLKSAAELFTPSVASQWGVVLRADTGDAACVIAEHADRRLNQRVKWRTIGVARVEGQRVCTIRLEPAVSETVEKVLDAAMAPGRVLADALRPGAKAPQAFRQRQGRWDLFAPDEDTLSRWSTPRMRALLESWPHGGAIAATDEHIVWRTNEGISADALDRVRQATLAARALVIEARR